MTNAAISDNFSLLAKLMELHGENPFKAKTYSIAAFAIDKLIAPLSEMEATDIFKIKNIGESAGKKIIEQIETGELQILNEYLNKTPKGVLEILLNIKGLGPKKVATIWKELECENIGELLYACEENRLVLYKGFGAKTQQNVIDSIGFYLQNQGVYLFEQAEKFEEIIFEQLQSVFDKSKIKLTGQLLRQDEIIDTIEYVVCESIDNIKNKLHNWDLINAIKEENESFIIYDTQVHFKLKFWSANSTQFNDLVFQYSCSPDFFKLHTKHKLTQQIPFAIRNNLEAIDLIIQNKLPKLIEPGDIKGIVHTHTTWSDGQHSIEEMALKAKEMGFEYLVISDHSKSAFYANGLTEERIKAQHQEIDELNEKIKGFKIFKSIECDILNDGSLDYSNDILSTFDLVIASVHSNLRMTEEKAMQRILNAIKNPYTKILGHPTGRLLLSRKGYPVDYAKIIEACKEHNVAIELNAHPRRLDIDWRYIKQATEAGVFISINPDSHSYEGFTDIRYGVLVAQKGMLSSKQNISSFSLNEFENWLAQ